MKALIGKIDFLLTKMQEYIIIVTGVAVCLLIFISAMMRYILKIDFYGSEEITLFTAFWLYFMGSAYAARKGTHINANMISMFVKNKKTVAVFDFIKEVLCLIMTIIITVWCYQYVMWSFHMGALSNVFKLPNVIGQIPILISFFLWACYMIRDVCRSFKRLKAIRKDGV